jgi:hypothetical protein
MATLIHHPIVYCPDNIDAYDFEPQSMNFDQHASPQAFYDNYAEQARATQKRPLCAVFPVDDFEFMIDSLPPNRTDMVPSIVEAQPVHSNMPSYDAQLPKVIVHTAPEDDNQRLKTFATFPIAEDRPSPLKRKHPIVLVIPSDGSQPCVATPILPKHSQKQAQAAQRQAISDIALPAMVEIETQPAPGAKKKHGVRRRRTACA